MKSTSKTKTTTKVKRKTRKGLKSNISKGALAYFKKSHYKSEVKYFEEIYRKHKAEINLKPERIRKAHGSASKAFVKAMTYLTKDEKMTYRKALKTILNSSTYSDISPQEASLKGITNFLSRATKVGLKHPRNAKGKFTKFDPSKFKYRGSGKSNGNNYIIFEYNGQFIVEFKSPKDGTGATIFVYNSEQEARNSL